MNRRTALSLAAVILAASGLMLSRVLVINLTTSLPRGIYLRTDKPPQRGDIVLAAPPDSDVFREARDRGFMISGLSPSGTGHLIKIMASEPGDCIRITEGGMAVNGKDLPGSARRDTGLAHAVPVPFEGICREVLLYTPHPYSFDSRYFGPVPETCIISTLKPLITFKS